MRKLLFLFVLILFAGCSTIRYIPIETTKTEIVHVHDTLKQSDSIKKEKETVIREARPEDSAMIAKLGIKLQNNERLLILLQKELQQSKNSKEKVHEKDSVRTDTIQVPYKVPAKLTKWQRLKVDWGGWAFLDLILISLFSIIYMLKRKRPL